MNCSLCNKPLSGGMDTFGEVGQEMCWDCYSSLLIEGEEEEITEWYGMAPHHHDFAVTGTYIGSTVLDPLPEPNANGEYEIEPGLFFRPDPEVDGAMGTWRDEREGGNDDHQR